MRIGLDYRPAIFSRSGIARSVRELARALQSLPELQTELFAHGFRRAHEDLLSHARATHGASLHRSRLPGRSLAALASIGFDATRLCRRAKRVDIFHWTDYVYPPVRSATPVTMTVHDVAFAASEEWHGARSTPALRARFEAALARCTAIATPSNATRSMLLEHFELGVPVAVIPFGVDHAATNMVDAKRGRQRAQEELGTDEPYFVMLGTLEPRKRHAEVLEALRMLAARGRAVPLLVLGADGWQNDEVKARLRETDAFPCAWRADLRDADVYDIVAGARGLLYPSSLEGFGFPPLEALELGVPPIVGDCAALRETCGPAAIFVDGGDPEAIAAAVEVLLDEEDARRALLRAWGERRIGFTWQRCAKRYAEFWSQYRGAPS